MKTYKLITLIFTVPVVINFTAMGLTQLDIYNNYDAKINYAVDSSPTEAVRQLNEVKNWMENKNIKSGNTCIFITTNPNCELKNYYDNRVLQSIKESIEVNKNDITAVSNLSLKLNEIFIGKGDKGTEYVKKPINLNLYLRWKNLNTLGWLIDLYCWFYLLFIWAVFYLLLQ